MPKFGTGEMFDTLRGAHPEWFTMAHVPRPRTFLQKAALRMDDNGAMLQRVRATYPDAFAFRHRSPLIALAHNTRHSTVGSRVTMTLMSFCVRASR